MPSAPTATANDAMEATADAPDRTTRRPAREARSRRWGSGNQTAPVAASLASGYREFDAPHQMPTRIVVAERQAPRVVGRDGPRRRSLSTMASANGSARRREVTSTIVWRTACYNHLFADGKPRRLDQRLRVALGAPGLLLVTFVDSSVLSLPELADILIVLMVARDKARLPLYVLCATVGRWLAASYLLHRPQGRRSAPVRRRFQGPSVDRTMGALRRHGMLAVLVPAILPPPMPFKIFVFLAGVADITPADSRGGPHRSRRPLRSSASSRRYGDRGRRPSCAEHGSRGLARGRRPLVVAAVAIGLEPGASGQSPANHPYHGAIP